VSDGRGGAPVTLTQAPVSGRIELPPYTFWATRTGTGTPIVLIHGLGGSADWWRRNVSALSARHTVAAVDLIGFGRNRFFLRRSSLPLTFDEIASLLARWLESAFDGPVHLVGNSMGGQIAIHLAARRPELVRSLVLVNATGIPFELKPGQHLENLMIPPGMLSFARVLARDLFRSGPTSVALALKRLLLDDARPLLRTLRMPVLLLWGESDPLVPLAYAREMLTELPDGRLAVVPHAGHVPMWENPEAFQRELLAFIDGVERVRPRDGDAEAVEAFSWPITGWTDGVAHREAGRARDIVLVHGLGMSSAYFVRLAKALFDRGRGPVAPDLRGFGESANAPGSGPEEHARELAAWADFLGIRDAVWAGHSTGCNAVAHLASARPDLVRHALFLSPLWSDSRHPVRRLAVDLLADALREPPSLWPFILRAYWRAGLWRWFVTFRRHVAGFRSFPPLTVSFSMIAGGRDPLIDTATIRALDPHATLDLPGAHAMHFSHPEETADACLRSDGENGRAASPVR
jgi:pimeloyl-ACP methyl ester carboxylesterase